MIIRVNGFDMDPYQNLRYMIQKTQQGFPLDERDLDRLETYKRHVRYLQDLIMQLEAP